MLAEDAVVLDTLHAGLTGSGDGLVVNHAILEPQIRNAEPNHIVHDSRHVLRSAKYIHKIDPAIDGEREYVNDTLSSTGLVIQRAHITPPNALLTAKTATGGEFHSDGRILILVLKDTASGAN